MLSTKPECNIVQLYAHDTKDLAPLHLDPESLDTQPNKSIVYRYARLIVFTITSLALLAQLAQICMECLHTTSPSSDTQRSSGESIDHIPASICGTNSRTARRSHCIFDPIAFAWLPSTCVDEGLLSQYLDLYDWTWYKHSERQVSREFSVLPLAEVLSGRYDVVAVNQNFLKLRDMYLLHSGEQHSMTSSLDAESNTDINIRESLFNGSWISKVTKMLMGSAGSGLVTLEAKYLTCSEATRKT